MTEKQADMMLGYLDVIAYCLTVMVAQGQKKDSLSGDELQECRSDGAESVRMVYESLRRSAETDQ